MDLSSKKSIKKKKKKDIFYIPLQSMTQDWYQETPQSSEIRNVIKSYNISTVLIRNGNFYTACK